MKIKKTYRLDNTRMIQSGIIANCSGCNGGCKGAQIANCGGCIANASGEEAEQLTEEAADLNMSVVEFQKYLESKGETEKASKIKTLINDGTIKNVITQGFDIFSAVKNAFKGSSSSAPTAPTEEELAYKSAKESEDVTKTWLGLPVWGWVVIGITFVLIVVATVKSVK